MIAYDSPAKSYGLLGPSATAIYSTEWAYITLIYSVSCLIEVHVTIKAGEFDRSTVSRARPITC